MIKMARVINLTICGILYLRRYGNNFHSPEKLPGGVRKAALVCFDIGVCISSRYNKNSLIKAN